jgi:hypothetical protein
MSGSKEHRGISTFIAVLLLMVLAVSAGVVLYTYTMGYLGNLGGTQTPGAMSVDTAKLNATTNVMTAYIRNVGTSSISIDTVYVAGEQIASGSVSVNPDPIQEGSVANVTVTFSASTSGRTYEVRLIAKDNTMLVFNVKAE